MTPWVLFSGVVGVVVGAIGKYYFDVLAGRKARLLDEKLRHVVKFFEAADRVWRTSAGVDTAFRTIDNISGRKHQPEEREQALSRLRDRQAESASAFMEAEAAYAAIRLLIPTAAAAVRKYLDICNETDWRDKKRGEREDARNVAEDVIRKALGA